MWPGLFVGSLNLDLKKIASRCLYVGKAWLLLAIILLTFIVTRIGVLLVARLLAHAL